MVILLQIIKKITFKKSRIFLISHNVAKILTENCFFFFFKFFHGFSEIGLEKIAFENLEKNPSKLHYQTLIKLVVTK